jgi:2-dehydropantoate 2-reductase
MKICLYGAGAVGGHIAGRLAGGRAEVSIVERGPQLQAIRAHGLRVETHDRTLISRPVVTDEPGDLPPQDLVIVAVKAPILPKIAAGVACLLHRDSLVLFVGNGIPWWYFHAHGGAHDETRLPRLDPDHELWRLIGPQRAVGCVAYTAGSVLGPGVIHAENARNRLIIGRPDGQPDPRVEALARLLSSGGLEVAVTARIRDAIWAKLLVNLVGGSLGVLTVSATKDVLDKPAVSALAKTMADECAAIAHAFGCDPGDPGEAVKKLATSNHLQSIVQDLEAGRLMEIDAWFRVPLKLAELAQVPTPHLDLVVELATQRARAAGLYPAN